MSRKIGYARVSTDDQNLQRQLDWMTAQNVDVIYQEKKSGKNLEREEFQKMFDSLQEGDTLYVESLSRISRSMKDLLIIVDELEKHHVKLVSLNDPVDFSTPDGHLMMGIIAAMNQYHREVMLERQKEGIEQAKLRNAYTGRKRMVDTDTVLMAMQSWAAGKSLRQAANEAGMSTKRLKNRIDVYQIKAGKDYTLDELRQKRAVLSDQLSD